MDLALNLGKTLEEVDAIPVTEYELWARYASLKALPTRRIEFYLAQIARKFVQVMSSSGEHIPLEDFMFDPADPEDVAVDDDDDADIDEARQFFNFVPRVVKE